VPSDPLFAHELALLRAARGGVEASALAAIDLRVAAQALDRAFNDCFVLMAIAIASALALVALLARPRAAANLRDAH
jgi:hypothetical protein